MHRFAALFAGLCLLISAFLFRVQAEVFSSAGHEVRYDVFPSASPEDPRLILLPGTAGPESPFYRDQAAFFAKSGFTTLLLHFFDADKSRTPSDRTYRAWATALEDLVRLNESTPGLHRKHVYVVGYSLGASIALAAGSENLPVQAIAEYYGSLPDSFFMDLKGMPPLLILHGANDGNIPVLNAQQLIRLCGLKSFDCDNHIYPGEGHGFQGAALADAHRRTLAFFAGHTSVTSAVSP